MEKLSHATGRRSSDRSITPKPKLSTGGHQPPNKPPIPAATSAADGADHNPTGRKRATKTRHQHGAPVPSASSESLVTTPKLSEIESRMRANKGNELAFARDMLRIEKGKLYRPKYPSIQEYAAKVWHIKRRQFYKLTEWAKVLECILNQCPKGHTFEPSIEILIPKRVARELATLLKSPEKLYAAYEEILKGKRANDGALSTSVAHKAVSKQRDKIDQEKLGKFAKAPTSDFSSRFICADMLDESPLVKDDSVDLIITSPPYGIGDGIKYNTHKDTEDQAEYLRRLAAWAARWCKMLKSGGRVAVNLPNTGSSKSEKTKEYLHPLPKRLMDIMEKIPGMMFYQDITWNRLDPSEAQRENWGSFCSCSMPNARRVSEHVVIFSKDSFERKADPTLSLLDGETFTGELTQDIWHIRPDTTTRKKYPHPCIYPLQLVERIIRLYGQKTDLIVDTFGGSGTTAIAAHICGCNFVSIDLDPIYTNMAHTRFLDYFKDGEKESTIRFLNNAEKFGLKDDKK